MNNTDTSKKSVDTNLFSGSKSSINEYASYAAYFRLDQKICGVWILLIAKKDIPRKAFTTNSNVDFKGNFCGKKRKQVTPLCSCDQHKSHISSHFKKLLKTRAVLFYFVILIELDQKNAARSLNL